MASTQAETNRQMEYKGIDKAIEYKWVYMICMFFLTLNTQKCEYFVENTKHCLQCIMVYKVRHHNKSEDKNKAEKEATTTRRG